MQNTCACGSTRPLDAFRRTLPRRASLGSTRNPDRSSPFDDPFGHPFARLYGAFGVTVVDRVATDVALPNRFTFPAPTKIDFAVAGNMSTASACGSASRLDYLFSQAQLSHAVLRLLRGLGLPRRHDRSRSLWLRRVSRGVQRRVPVSENQALRKTARRFLTHAALHASLSGCLTSTCEDDWRASWQS